MTSSYTNCKIKFLQLQQKLQILVSAQHYFLIFKAHQRATAFDILADLLYSFGSPRGKQSHCGIHFNNCVVRLIDIQSEYHIVFIGALVRIHSLFTNTHFHRKSGKVRKDHNNNKYEIIYRPALTIQYVLRHWVSRLLPSVFQNSALDVKEKLVLLAILFLFICLLKIN